MISAKKDMPVFTFDSGSESLSIPLPKFFSFKETLHYLTRSPQECLHQVDDGEIYKLLKLDSQKILIRIRETNASSLELEIVDGLKTERIYRKAAEYTADWLDLHSDLEPFYVLANQDPILRSLTETYNGLRIIGIPDLYEALIWAVIGQQINLAFAYTLKKRLAETYGTSHVWNGRTFWAFPDPSVIAAISIEDFRTLQFTNKKAEYIIGISKLAAEGKLTKEELLKEKCGDALEEKLLAIKGIGPWTARYVMMRCLRYSSSLPYGDAALNKALQNAGFKGSKLTRAEIETVFSLWKPWEAYAVFYFWRSLSKD
ncbi:DNA-3-methyladenine glycosylase 2 [Bacillus sp. FJAT-42376]|uniref:DNA-3-methyladenine glycosylase family protein n=1 Tax=Bacillus sp. FJAT-42376 TaxID=2014076 RepID=UPI000F4E34FE|nr:DNA-3-methyladenine glycosylase 2 [Bacillus sp. FJAT-42376]AZB43139.1 DNA-3-methyladenine glycosylase 2 [Bacillus sp. FJAT-42376]